MLCFAFLPVAFSRIAVTDVGTLAPVALALLFAVRIARGRAAALVRRWRASAAGLAIGFKYTAGLVLLAARAGALALRARSCLGATARRCARAAAWRARASAAARCVAFFVTNPYFFLDFDDGAAPAARPGRAGRQPGQVRPGARQRPPLLPRQPDVGARLGGAPRPRSPAPCCSRGATACGWRCCSLFPVALFVYLSAAVALLRALAAAGLPGARAARGLRGRARRSSCVRARAPRLGWPRGRRRAACSLLWQPLAADARSMARARPAATRARSRATGSPTTTAASCASSSSRPCPSATTGRSRGGRPAGSSPRAQFVDEFIRDIRETHVEYGRTLQPARARPLPPPGLLHGHDDGPDPRARRGRRATAPRSPTTRGSSGSPTSSTRVSPYRADADPPPFSFDLSYSYYSPAYERPGPEVDDLPAARLRAALRAACARGGEARPGGAGERGRAAPAALGRRSARRSLRCSPRSALRLWHIDHGLPFAYNADEARALRARRRSRCSAAALDPGYYENPPALTYLLYAIFKLRFTRLPVRRRATSCASFAADPEAAFLTARVAVALIGTLVVGLAYWAGARFYERRVGLVAAALMAVAFLPVFYSKHALNDVVTLAPVTVALVGCLLVYERGRWLDWALAGAARRRRDRDEVHGRARCC